MAIIEGTCDERFAKLKDLLGDSIDARTDLGASIAVVHEGEMVVDIWGGFADESRTVPWEADTITNVWSSTKTMMALTALLLIDRGELDPNRAVADYWPEFAAEGKGAIEVRQLMSHTSGVSGWAERVTVDDICDWDKSTALLAAQAPWWKPGTASGYHALNQGHLVGEVVRRITGQSLGSFFRTEVAQPLGADFHIGLAAEHDERVSRVIPPPATPLPGEIDLDSVAMKTFLNPMADATMSYGEKWRRAEIPAANGHGHARGVATAQALIANGGEYNGVRLLSQATIDRIFEVQSQGTDLVLGISVTFGLGYAMSSGSMPYLPGSRICFWGGWGGSLVVHDLDARLTITYMMNQMGSELVGDARGANLIAAIYAGLA